MMTAAEIAILAMVAFQSRSTRTPFPTEVARAKKTKSSDSRKEAAPAARPTATLESTFVPAHFLITWVTLIIQLLIFEAYVRGMQWRAGLRESHRSRALQKTLSALFQTGPSGRVLDDFRRKGDLSRVEYLPRDTAQNWKWIYDLRQDPEKGKSMCFLLRRRIQTNWELQEKFQSGNLKLWFLEKIFMKLPKQSGMHLLRARLQLERRAELRASSLRCWSLRSKSMRKRWNLRVRVR